MQPLPVTSAPQWGHMATHLLASDATMSVSEKLAERLEDLRPTGYSQEDVAEALARITGQFSQQSVSRYQKNPLMLINKGVNFMKIFFAAYQFSEPEVNDLISQVVTEWFSKKRAEYAAYIPNRGESDDVSTVMLGVSIPVYPAGSGPAWALDDVLETIQVPEAYRRYERLVGLRAMGTSMEPYLPKGAIAVIALDDGLCQPGDHCAVWLHGDGVVIKRFVAEMEDGRLMLESLNPEPGDPRVFPAPAGSRVMGKVVGRHLPH